MDITQENLQSNALRIIKEIAESHLVALDCEFSGIALNSGPKPNLAEFYQAAKEAAEKYQILQVGLTIVAEDIENARYVRKPYNIYVSPLPDVDEKLLVREWTSTNGCKLFTPLPLVRANGTQLLASSAVLEWTSTLSSRTA
jgi:poly(A)-specific ribonuclease